MDRFADFDAAFGPADGDPVEPVRIRLFGHVWELPGEMPAAAPLRVSRLMADGRSEESLTDAEVLALGADLIPGQVLDAWHARGLTLQQLEQIILWLIGQYGQPTSPAGDAQGEATPPPPMVGDGPRSSSSSNDGGWSRPTSPASTGSSSPPPFVG